MDSENEYSIVLPSSSSSPSPPPSEEMNTMEMGGDQLENYWDNIDTQLYNFTQTLKVIHYGIELVLANYIQRKPLQDFTEEELMYFPLNYLQQHVTPSELLHSWEKLPTNYKLDLMFDLPCKKHYNQENQNTHVDGPSPKRRHCFDCINELHQLKNL
jgi:hypothetical protein